MDAMSERMRLFWKWWAVFTGLLFVESAVLNANETKRLEVLLLALAGAAIAYRLSINVLLAVYRRLYRVWTLRSDAWRIDGHRMVRKERH